MQVQEAARAGFGFADIDWSKPWFAQFAARGERWQQGGADELCGACSPK